MTAELVKINIRVGGKEDSQVLSQLSKTTFQGTFAKDNAEADMQLYLSENFHIAHIDSELQEPNARFFIAEIGREAVGYAKVGRKQTPVGLAGKRDLEVERLYVLKEFQGKGIGEALLKTCVQYALNNKVEVLWLGVWEHNDKAKNFYKAFGFAKFGEHPFILGTDVQTDWMMMMDLK